MGPRLGCGVMLASLLCFLPSVTAQEESSPRIFGIIPNHRTSATLTNYQPLTAKEKFKIAERDSFDGGALILSAVFGGEGQLRDAQPSFGQGMAGYGRYFATSYADFVTEYNMTEAVFPTLLHQDPRYFRRGTGSGWSRVRYSFIEIFRTHNDSGRPQFNYSQIGGNCAAVAISTAYYPDSRTAADAASKLGVQIGMDWAANLLKEFSPDLSRKFSRKRHDLSQKSNGTP